MNIQIASFALVPDQIYTAEKYYHSDKLILVLSDENKNENIINNNETSSAVITSIEGVMDFYRKLNVPVEKIYVDYKNFIDMVLKFAELLEGFSNEDKILLNLSGGRRSIPIALIYASTFISNSKNIDIKCVVIPEDKSYMPFNLLPQYIPDKKDVILMSKLYLKKPLTELENLLGIKQPAISLRLKKLEKFGYIFVNGRDRELSDLAKLIVKINITNNKIT